MYRYIKVISSGIRIEAEPQQVALLAFLALALQPRLEAIVSRNPSWVGLDWLLPAALLVFVAFGVRRRRP